MSARTVRAAIVEDEPQARRTLRAYLDGVDWIEIAGEAGDGAAAVRLVDELEPDLLFLDVRLPELSGLEVVERIRHPSALVFTTAHDRFAVAAFELGALDYLLKPFGRERLARCVERVRAHSTARRARRGRAHAGEALSAAPARRLFARTAAHRADPGGVDPPRPGGGRLRGGPLRGRALPAPGQPVRAALAPRPGALPPGPPLAHREPGHVAT